MATPAFHSKRSRRKTYGGEVAAVGSELGYDLMKWQRRALNVMLEYDSDGWRFPQGAISVPRQSGKSFLQGLVIAWWLRKWDNQVAVLVAQDRKAAARRLESLAGMLDAAGWESRYLMGSGNELLLLPNGSRCFVVAGSRSSGHGESIDLALLDECWSLDKRVMQALVPAQIARPNWFRLAISTAGDEESSLWNDMVERGREATGDASARFSFVEYSPTPGVDIMDSSNWGKWMPAIGETQKIQDIMDASGDLGGVGSSEWLRAFGNITVRSDANLFERHQVETAVQSIVPATPARVAIGVDVSQAPDAASLVYAWMGPDEQMYVKVQEWQQGIKAAEIAAAVDKGLTARPGSSVTIGAGPSILVKPDLEDVCRRHGVELFDRNMTGMAGAAMRLFEHVRDGTLGVVDLGEVFADAAMAARAKAVGDRWRFERVLVDQSPLIAAALAVDTAWADSFTPKVAIY